MTRRFLVLGAALAVVATVLVSTGAASAHDPFAGVWISPEGQSPDGDGSTNITAIGLPGQNGARSWVWYETFATFCGGGPMAAAGKGRSEGQVLTVTVTWLRCANGSPGSTPTPFDLTFDATTDGHLDLGGLIFTRFWVSLVQRG